MKKGRGLVNAKLGLVAEIYACVCEHVCMYVYHFIYMCTLSSVYIV